jgi:hypothetical protein
VQQFNSSTKIYHTILKASKLCASEGIFFRGTELRGLETISQLFDNDASYLEVPFSSEA